MKTLGFHRGVYAEGMRKLSTLGWLSLILVSVFCSLPHVLAILRYGAIDRTFEEWYYRDMMDVFFMLYLLPFILPTVFTAKLFAFQNNRRDSDFYHSLPVTRSTLHLSLLAAVATWCGIVVCGSALVVCPLGVLVVGPMDFLGAVLCVAAAVVSCLFVASVVFLGYTLSGNAVSALFASGILLFVPTAISAALSSVMAYDIQVIRMERLQLNNYQLLYGKYESLTAWIVTMLITLLCLGLGLWVGARRPSETAGRSSITPALQHLFRLLAAFTVCLWPITELYEVVVGGAHLESYNATKILQGYLFALAVYFLFELITTRKVKNLIKAIPWLGALAAMNVVCLLGMSATVFTFNTIDKSINGDVAWVQMIEPLEYWGYEKDANGGVSVRYHPHRDSIDPFEEFADAYRFSMCDKVQLDSTKACDIAKTALERAIDYRELEDEGVSTLNDMAQKAEKQSGYIYQVELRIKVGFFPRERVVYLYDHEMESLLKHIDTLIPVPKMDTLLEWHYE
ncbi:MAG: hypothetical protein IJC52_04470 [Clostridia bacterium]|nr:hypothetical protein [Clostridia bacterium]